MQEIVDKKVISFVLWGNDIKYTQGAIENAEMSEDIYPGWETSIVVHDNVEKNMVSTLKNVFDTVVMYSGHADYSGVFRRYDIMTNKDVDVCVFRDCDSRLCDKGFQAVKEWLNSDKQIHTMKDHKNHITPIMGGMWGIKRKGLISISMFNHFLNRFCKAANCNRYRDDELVLSYFAKVYSKHILSHSNKKIGKYPYDVDFPAHKPFKYGTFIGEPICRRE